MVLSESNLLKTQISQKSKQNQKQCQCKIILQ